MAPWFSRRKWVAVALAMSLSSILTGCGDDEEEEDEDTLGRRPSQVVQAQL